MNGSYSCRSLFIFAIAHQFLDEDEAHPQDRISHHALRRYYRLTIREFSDLVGSRQRTTCSPSRMSKCSATFLRLSSMLTPYVRHHQLRRTYAALAFDQRSGLTSTSQSISVSIAQPEDPTCERRHPQPLSPAISPHRPFWSQYWNAMQHPRHLVLVWSCSLALPQPRLLSRLHSRSPHEGAF